MTEFEIQEIMSQIKSESISLETEQIKDIVDLVDLSEDVKILNSSIDDSDSESKCLNILKIKRFL